MDNHPPQPQAVSSRVTRDTLERAINALLKWRNSKTKTIKPLLLEEDEFIYLILTLKKIPPKSRTNPFKVNLPHPLINPETDHSELCLIIDDRSKSHLTKEDAQKKIKSENIPISKVIKISKLKTDYRPFEAKRKLCGSYDMFFADKRVIPLLPKLLGKQFFKKKKIPVPVDLKHKNWKEQIEKACGSALLYLRTGTCSVIKVGKVSMSKNEIVENVVAAIDGIGEIVPRKWGNVRSFHLKMFESLALPVYQAVPDLKLKIETGQDDKERKKEGEKESEVDINDGRVERDKKMKKKGRIHEVRYMDSNIGELFDEDELGGDSEGEIGLVGNIENDEMGSAEVGGKKRKKGGDKQVKKVRKNEDGANRKKQKEEVLPVNGGEEPGGKKEKKTRILKLSAKRR
ncbi:Ribosomal_L1 domain-containing protein [Cephalotus follicularis]|uniref:Ribosomal_L1 domain-containing protein n=1 Tax=Cephalotus follicularis TaxID=3775 RepID=A0A1Q3BAY7_CEPFO|nr:Ribosomal_L1 domain-containing protein [Cephalotus follicularis]